MKNRLNGFHIKPPSSGLRNAEAIELVKQIIRDRNDWLDETMRKLTPPSLHKFITAEGPHSEKVHPRLKAFLHENQIQVVQMQDGEWRIAVKGVHVAQFKPTFSVDGRPFDLAKGTWRD